MMSRTSSPPSRPPARASGERISRWASTVGATDLTSSGLDELPARDERARLGDPQEREAGARARAQEEAGVRPRVPQHGDDVAVEALLDEDVLRALDRAEHLLGARHALERVERRLGRVLGEHPRLVGERRVADRDPHREAVELGLGQRVGALVLDRVLRRHDHEGRRELVGDAVDRDLALLHALEQRRLGLRRRSG